MKIHGIEDEHQKAVSIGIIGGADGPTSVLISDKKRKMPFKVRMKNHIYKCKRRIAEKRIVAGVHTLEEVIVYAADTYGAVEADAEAYGLPASSHIYEIKNVDNCLEIEIDYAKDTFGVSFSGSKKTIKHCRKIAKDLYIYYGVSEDDIKNKTRRYFSLLGILSI